MPSPTLITLVGATGLTGASTLSALLRTKSPLDITTIARKAINPDPAAHPETVYSHNLVSDLFDAPSGEVGKKGGVYISCLGTTRGTAGSLAEQEKLDLGLNRDLARKAKEDGAERLILVSSGRASSDSMFPYTRMKGQLEDEVKAMGFTNCIILQPGLLMGSRNEFRGPEYISQVIFRGFRSVGLPMNRLMVDAEDVGACIAYYASQPPLPEKVTVLDNMQIIADAKKWREANGQS